MRSSDFYPRSDVVAARLSEGTVKSGVDSGGRNERWTVRQCLGPNEEGFKRSNKRCSRPLLVMFDQVRAAGVTSCVSKNRTHGGKPGSVFQGSGELSMISKARMGPFQSLMR